MDHEPIRIKRHKLSESTNAPKVQLPEDKHMHMLRVRMPNGPMLCVCSYADPKEPFREYTARVLLLARDTLEINGYNTSGISLAPLLGERIHNLPVGKTPNPSVEDVLENGEVLSVCPDKDDFSISCQRNLTFHEQSRERSNIQHSFFEKMSAGKVLPLSVEPECTFVMFCRMPNRVVRISRFFDFSARLCCVGEFSEDNTNVCHSAQPMSLGNLFAPSVSSIKTMIPVAGERIYTSLKPEDELTDDMVHDTRCRDPDNPRRVRHPYREEVSCHVMQTSTHEELQRGLYFVKAELLYTGEITFKVRINVTSHTVNSEFYVMVYIGNYCARTHDIRCIRHINAPT